jgi:hypothetical protein
MVIAMGQSLFLIGLVLMVLGGIVTLVSKFGAKGLPGDIVVQKGSTTFFFPIVSCIVISIVLSIILNLFRK